MKKHEKKAYQLYCRNMILSGKLPDATTGKWVDEKASNMSTDAIRNLQAGTRGKGGKRRSHVEE